MWNLVVKMINFYTETVLSLQKLYFPVYVCVHMSLQTTYKTAFWENNDQSFLFLILKRNRIPKLLSDSE